VVIERRVRFGMAELIPDRWRSGGWTVAVDGAAQSYVDVRDPTFLAIPYTSWMAAVVDRGWPAGQAVSAVHVGGGGCTVPRYVAATRPGSTQVVFEPDDALVSFVAEHLGLDGLDVRITDGRDGIAGLPADSADLVVLDVFRGGDLVTDMATVEFLRETARVVGPGGSFVANVWDGEELMFARRFAATVEAAYPHAVVMGEAGTFLRSRPGNLVVAASDEPLPVGELTGCGKASGNKFFCLTAKQFAALCGRAPVFTAAEDVIGPAGSVRPWGRGSRYPEGPAPSR
jgi:SAM-dependent methyltransferase